MADHDHIERMDFYVDGTGGCKFVQHLINYNKQYNLLITINNLFLLAQLPAGAAGLYVLGITCNINIRDKRIMNKNVNNTC